MGCDNVVVTFRKRGQKPYQFVVQPGTPLWVGRAPDCDIHVISSDVSSRHVELYVEAPHGEVPSFLKVVAPNGPESIPGTYAIVAGETRNGHPLWRKVDEPYWIYSMTNNKWGFGGLREKDADFKSSSAYVFCPFTHDGKMPSAMGATWKRNNPMWTDDKHFLVIDFSPTVPPLLYVEAPNGPRYVVGVYALDEDTQPNGCPLWKKMDDDFWIYSMSTQRWAIGGVAEKKSNFRCSGAHLYSATPHKGMMPHSMGKSWKRNNPAWTDDSQICVKSTTFGSAEVATKAIDAHISARSMKCLVRDASSNGTGIMGDAEDTWRKLAKGTPVEISGDTMFVLPFNRKGGAGGIEFSVQVFEDSLPDPYDVRTGTGRWKYGDKLGEGALGVVYRAFDANVCICTPKKDLTSENDMHCKCFRSDSCGGVALKVLKEYQKDRSKRLRRAYILHREAQWSMQLLHNSKSPGFCHRRAALFARYFEDHTGVCSWTGGIPDWQKERSFFEVANFKWEQFHPSALTQDMPYVVMEFVPGNNVHILMGFSQAMPSDFILSSPEKIAIIIQATEALDYLTNFGLIHRDFRTTNLLWVGRGPTGRLSVIDLGLMLHADEAHTTNKSAVVRVNWRGTDKNPFDWAPGEVRIGSGRDFVNFQLPSFSFDIFSLAALSIQLETASTKVARKAIAEFSSGAESVDCLSGRHALGLSFAMLKLMLGRVSQRPHPRTVLLELQKSHPKYQPSLEPLIRKPCHRRDRSRSRSRDHHHRHDSLDL